MFARHHLCAVVPRTLRAVAGVALAGVLLAGCGSDPASEAVGPATAPSPNATIDASVPGVAGSSPDGGAVDLCALAPQQVLSRIAADFDPGTPGADLQGDDASCVFASVAKPEVVVRFGLREDVSDPITFLEPKPFSTDSRRLVPGVGDIAYYDPKYGVLSIALDSRIATVFVSYGNGQTESEPTFGELGAAVAAGLGWVAAPPPSVDPCSLASPAEIAGQINDLAPGELARANTEFGAGAECRMSSAAMGPTESVRIVVVDGVDAGAARSSLGRLQPVPELGDQAFADDGSVLILDGTRVVRIRVNRNAMASQDAAVAVGRIVAGHLDLPLPDPTVPADSDDAGSPDETIVDPVPSEDPITDGSSGTGSGNGICALVPAELLAEVAYDLQVGVESVGRAVAYDEQVCTWTSTSQASLLEVGVADEVDSAALRSSWERSGQQQVEGLGDVAYFDPANGRLRILAGATQVQIRVGGNADVRDLARRIGEAVLVALGR